MQKSCTQCRQNFGVTDEDLKFFERVSPEIGGKKQSIQPPTLCHDCRQQRRFVWRNERHLYHRKCSKTGRQMIAAYPQDSRFPVYDQHVWWKDDWDATEFGRAIDFGRPFFDQFAELLSVVPRLSLCNSNNENCDYVNYTNYSKDCYLIFGNHTSEKCCYGWRVHHCLSCFDCAQLNRCKYCHDCVDCDDCYQLFSSTDCQNCSDSSHLLSCRSCKSCLYCCNLQNAEYCILNKKYSREDFLKAAVELRKDSVGTERKYRELLAVTPHKAVHTLRCEDCLGDYLIGSKGCRQVFSAEDCRDCTRVYLSESAKDCADCDIVGWPAELCYEGISTCVNAYLNRWCSLCWTCSDISYCDSCFTSKNLFGCVGLRQKQFCILNKQYTKEEYEKLVPLLIEHMRKTPLRSFGATEGQAGEWGEFFPASISPFGYNETLAQEYFPLKKEEATARHCTWHDEDPASESYMGPDVALPAKIEEVQDDICKQVLRCEVTGKPYKIIPQELAFYRSMSIPIPRKCPDQRHADLMMRRNPRRLWKRECAKCNKEIQTTYSPQRPEIIYCESCYLATVY